MRTLEPRAADVRVAGRPQDEPLLAAAREAVMLLFGPVEERDFSIRYWTGREDSPARDTTFQLMLMWPGALRKMFLPPSELAIADAFIRGDCDVRGDLAAAASLGPRLFQRLRAPRRIARLVRILLSLPRYRSRGDPMQAALLRATNVKGPQHDRDRDLAAVRHHYDVGNDFYALWLDPDFVYSCAYFERGGETLDAAQAAKLDHICRKLRLQPGERFLDIGCGWGALVRHAARHYGADAVGVTLSEAQAESARSRIVAEGLQTACRVDVRDYRDLPTDQPFDKVASIGMSEHVGRSRLPEYFDAVYRLTKPGGLFLNHCIVSLEDARPRRASETLARRLWREGSFIDRYVFPDGDLPPLATLLAAAEGAGFETRDVESLREHYARTLRHWSDRLQRRTAEARRLVGAARLRVWRLYLAASEHAFQSARLSIVQKLLARPDETGQSRCPPTRAGLYAKGTAFSSAARTTSLSPQT